MTSEEFMGFVYYPHVGLYFIVLFVVICLYCFALKKRIDSIIIGAWLLLLIWHLLLQCQYFYTMLAFVLINILFILQLAK